LATKGAEVTSGIAKSAKHVDSVTTIGMKNKLQILNGKQPRNSEFAGTNYKSDYS